MTIVPGDPKIAPRFCVTRKAGGTEHTLRTIDPPIGNPSKQ